VFTQQALDSAARNIEDISDLCGGPVIANIELSERLHRRGG
jgi:hypothetical protein